MTPRNGSSGVPGPRPGMGRRENFKKPPGRREGRPARSEDRPVVHRRCQARAAVARQRVSPGRAPKARRPGLRPRDQENGGGPKRNKPKQELEEPSPV